MKRRMKMLTSLALAGTMVVSMAACGGSNSSSAKKSSSGSASSASASSSSAAAGYKYDPVVSDDGKVLNIQVWNTEWKERVESYYPGYEVDKSDKTGNTGKIGDVTVKWTITPSDDGAYQKQLDSILPDNTNASADDKVDIFLAEVDYIKKYVNSNTTLNLSDIGIEDGDLSDQFQYPKDVATDVNGNLKGSSWQTCPAGLIYNRAIAKDVLGTDDPDKVQEQVSDWDKFAETAKKVADKGYTMCSAYDTYRVYSGNLAGPVVQDNKVVIDDSIKNWIDSSKKLVDAKEEDTYALWSDDWAKGEYPSGKKFCYFGPAWLFNFSISPRDDNGKLIDGTVAKESGWGFCAGPQSFSWGGTWVCAANGTDNSSLVKDLILTMTANEDTLRKIAKEKDDCPNSQTVMNELASDKSYKSETLAGQNPYPMYLEGINKIDYSKLSIYDQYYAENIQTAMQDYFKGNASYDEAIKAFKTAMKESCPELDED